jgi:hypothetical protein
MSTSINFRSPWSHCRFRCDDCGRFIGFNDFEHGATRKLDTPDSHFTAESYITLCKQCTINDESYAHEYKL